MGFEDGCNTGLVLGVGSSCEGKIESLKRDNLQEKPCLNLDRLFPGSSPALETSLSLCLLKSPSLDDMHKKIDVNKVCEEKETLLSSPHSSTVSSFSNMNYNNSNTCIKREREMGSEEFELERVSSRASDEDEDGNARKKLRLTKEQSALLEDSFKEHSTLNPRQKQALAKQLNLRPRQVEVWFQNRRARTKLKQTEVDCELLKRCCETLTDENRRLQKELQELKALKLASPLYMQLPAATLTMCPSCERLATNDSNKTTFSIAPKSHFYNPFTHSSTAF